MLSLSPGSARFHMSQRLYFIIVSVLLLITAVAKVVGLRTGTIRPYVTDAVFSEFPQVVPIAAAILLETAIALYIALSVNATGKHIAILWLMSLFISYRVIQTIRGTEYSCPCFGNAHLVLGLPARALDYCAIACIMLCCSISASVILWKSRMARADAVKVPHRR